MAIADDRWVQPMTDEELVADAQRDPQQFDALYLRYVDPVFRYAVRRLDRSAAEDATSATFLKALQAIHRFDPAQGTFRAWLFAIAHNAIVDQQRRQWTASLDEIDVAVGGQSVEDQAADAEQRMQLSAALQHLPDDQRDVIELRLANLTSPEIAAVLGKSPVAVRGLQHRAVRRLQTMLNPGLTSDSSDSIEGGLT